MRYIDLFCGIGGFRVASQLVFEQSQIDAECVFSSDIDGDAKFTYHANFGEYPAGDITSIDAQTIPDHDFLFAGFPCQPFSIIGNMQGFEDIRGTLFFEIVRILAAKKPEAFLLENVKQLKGHDNGNTLKHILETLGALGYHTGYKVLNALDFGLPQKRERVFIVGFLDSSNFHYFNWPKGGTPMLPLEEILENKVPEFYYASEMIKANRLAMRQSIESQRTIWHENKGGHISAYPYSCALRAGASYNYLLVDGKRRLTEREMLRLQGFPETFQIVCGYSAMRRLAGNSVAIPVVASVIRSMLSAMNYSIKEQDNWLALDLEKQLTFDFAS